MDRARTLLGTLTGSLLLATLAPAAPAQEPPPTLPPALDRAGATTELPLASDGQPAAPGRIPDDTEQGARALWAMLAGSLSVDDGTPAASAPRAFELEFDVRSRQASGTQNFSARFHYLDEGPGLVRGVVLDEQRAERSTQMRGVDARGRLQYWFRKVQGEGQTDGWQSLRGPDFREDRAQIDSWAAISFDIARLTRPSSFRILSMRERTVAASEEGVSPLVLRFEDDPRGVVLPDTDIEGVREGRKQKVHELCAGLRWLEVRTPDFRDFREFGGGGDPSFRLVFGMDPATGRPQVVLVAPGAEGPLQVPGAALVQCTEWLLHPAEGPPSRQSWLPGRFFAYETVPGAPGTSALRFSDVPRADLYFIDGDMRATLEPGFFLPR